MPRYWVITPQTHFEDIKEITTAREKSLEWLQKQVGGNVERAMLRKDGILWLNEVGRVAMLPSNDACIEHLDREGLCNERELLALMSWTGTIHGTVVVELPKNEKKRAR